MINTGDFLHFVPENNIYTVFRFNEEERIMNVLNMNQDDKLLNLSRFNEILKDVHEGKYVFTEEVIALDESISIPANSPHILEITK